MILPARRRVLSGLLSALSAACLFQGPVVAQSLSLANVGGGFTQPVFATSPRGDAERLFVLERTTGRIRILRAGVIQATDFLSLAGQISSNSERGLLGLAFHPDYAVNGRFFVHYNDLSGASRVVEYHVSSDPDVAEPAPVQDILTVSQPAPYHNGGSIEFGPDGMLYFGLGDGGSSSTAQDGSSLLGKMVRLDVDLPAPFIPADNPYLGQSGTRDEVWSRGLRNPWRFSFDQLTGDMWIADVGEAQREEINFVPAGSGAMANYGWDCKEGSLCTGSQSCNCTSQSLSDPIYEYTHAGGNCAILGGYVYRGSQIPWLQGTYFFGDFCSGDFWSFRYQDGQLSDFVDRSSQLNANCHQVSMAQDGVGEIYIVDAGCGALWRITGSCGADSFCGASPNSAGTGCRIGYTGSTNYSSNDLSLTAMGGVPGQNALFFYGPKVTALPFGDGALCVAPGTLGLHRLGPPLPFDSAGQLTRWLDLNAPPAGGSGPGVIQAGSAWYFQLWYRDPFGPGGTGFNLSDALGVHFCP